MTPKTRLFVTLVVAFPLIQEGCKGVPKTVAKPTHKIDEMSSVFSSLLQFEDTNLIHYKRSWDMRIDSDGKIRFVRDTSNTKASQRYISIVDRFRLAPMVNVVDFRDTSFSKDTASTGLLERFINNRDTSKFEAQIEGKYTYLFFDEALIKKPHFAIENLPIKYVKSYCKVGLSKPIFELDHQSCLVYMESPCMYGGKVYYMRKSNGKWVVQRYSTSSEFGIP